MAIDVQLLTEALMLVKNEFRALSGHEQYFNSFSRLLKPDPLQRVSMLGTDQRDQFLPGLRRLAASMPANSRVFDIGCGDGATFSLFAGSLPPASLTILDPNEEYLARYGQFLAHYAELRLEAALNQPYRPSAHSASGFHAGSFDLILALHSLYFFEDLQSALVDIYRLLAPGGAAFIVYADEELAYTGHAVRSYYSASGETRKLSAHAAACAERNGLLRADERGRCKIASVLDAHFPGSKATVSSKVQATRLFGHTLADIIALSNITELSGMCELRKFDVACELLRSRPEDVGLEVVRDPASARLGMYCVNQPQVEVIIRKPPRQAA